MKILIPTDNYYPNVNGASYFAQRLAYYLTRAGHEVLVVAPSRTIHDEVFEHEGVRIIGIRSMPFERIRVPLPLVIRRPIEKAIRAFHPDIVHIQSHFAIGRITASIARRLRTPVVGTNHFMPENLLHYLPIPDRSLTGAKWVAWKHCLSVLNRLDAVTSPTESAAELLRSVGIQQTVQVISNGIDLQRFRPTNNGGYLRARYALPDSPVLLFVGRLDKEKYLDRVLYALESVVRQVPIHVVIAGVGAEKKNLEALASTLGLRSDVTFVGFVPDEDLPNLYAIARCFIIAGTAELQSIVTMEAMATGLSIIAANAVALPELVCDGENGFLFEPSDVSVMTRCIVKMFGDRRMQDRMGKSSLRRIAPHEMSAVIQQFIGLYHNVIHGTKG